MSEQYDIKHNLAVIIVGLFLIPIVVPMHYVGLIVGYAVRGFLAGFEAAQKGGRHDRWMGRGRKREESL